MSQWLVTQGSNQFAVDGLGELERLARAGDLRAGDLIQPPGATDWIYAVEIPELEDLLVQVEADFEAEADLMARRQRAATATGIVAAVLLAVAVVGGGVMLSKVKQLPVGNEVLVGEGGLSFSEMVVTNDGVSLLRQPEANATVIEAVPRNSVLDLLAKRGTFYRARTKTGTEGWVQYDQVLPVYQLGGADVREEYDPLYNPDRYVEVANASWMQLPEQTEDHTTVFQFMMKNTSEYAMTDLVIQATIKDAKGHELEKVEIPIEGVIPARSSTMVGTLKPDPKAGNPRDEAPPSRLLTQHTFDGMARHDPDLQLRYSAGVEIQMSTSEFTNAHIDVVELRAVPDEAAADAVSDKD